MIAALEGVKRTYKGEAIINHIVEYFSELEQELSLRIKNTVYPSQIDDKKKTYNEISIKL